MASSASLYLYTFLATLVLLLSVSAAIVIRSLLLRRRHRRLVEEAIRNGTYVPGMFGNGAGLGGPWGGFPGGGRGNKVDLAMKPKLWEAYLGLGSTQTQTEKDNGAEKSQAHPLASGESGGPGSGSSRGGGGYGGGFGGAYNPYTYNYSQYNKEDFVDWEGIMPFSTSLTTPLPTSFPSSSTSANHTNAGTASGSASRNGSTTSVNRNASTLPLTQRIRNGLVHAPRAVWGLISTQQSSRRDDGMDPNYGGNDAVPVTPATATATTVPGTAAANMTSPPPSARPLLGRGASSVSRFLRASRFPNPAEASPTATLGTNNNTNNNNSSSNSSSNTTATKTSPGQKSPHHALPPSPTTVPVNLSVSVLIAMPSRVPLAERLSKPRPRPGAMEEEEDLPHLEVGICEVVVPPEVDVEKEERERKMREVEGKGKESMSSEWNGKGNEEV